MSRPRRKAKPADQRPSLAPAGALRAPTLDGITAETADLADFLNADGFAAFSVPNGAERQLLLHLKGGGKGETLLAALGGASGFGGEAARHALAASTPFWWGEEGEASERLRLLPAAARANWPGLPMPGLGLPCATDRGQCGLFLFWGENIALAAPNLPAVHATCFALFENLAACILRPDGEDLPHLTPRELECLRLAARGMTSRVIGSHLNLSPYTTDQHLSKAVATLDAVNRIHAVAKALRLGLLD